MQSTARVYDESYQLLLKRSKRPLLEKRRFLATEAEREALARGDFVRIRSEPFLLHFAHKSTDNSLANSASQPSSLLFDLAI